MLHVWTLLLFVRPVAYNHPYTNPVVIVGTYQTFAECSTLGALQLQQDDSFEEYACRPGHPVP